MIPLPSPRDILSEDQAPTPAWLASYQPGITDIPRAVDAFRRSRIVFHPGSRIAEDEPLDVFAASHAAHAILHAGTIHDAPSERGDPSRQPDPWIHAAGYRALDVQAWDAATTQELLGLEWSHPFGLEPALRGARWIVLERRRELPQWPEPRWLAYLEVHCDPTWLFWNLWARTPGKAPHALVLPDVRADGTPSHFGPNSTLHQLATRCGAMPRWLWSPMTSAWPHYLPVRGPIMPARPSPPPPEVSAGAPGGRTLHYFPDESVAAPTCAPTTAHPVDPGPPKHDLATSAPTGAPAATRLYFTFGSNMDPNQFHQRCPRSGFVGLAVLEDHQWALSHRGMATVKPHPGHQVHGVLAVLTPEDEARLDFVEGVHLGIHRRGAVTVRTAQGGQVQALVHVANDEDDGIVRPPRRGYLDRVVAGAHHHGLDASALAEIEAWRTPRLGPEARSIPVLIQGTLRRGQRDHALLVDSLFIGEAMTVGRDAMQLRGFPMRARQSSMSPVPGELYEVTPTTLDVLDLLEGHPLHRRRARVPVQGGGSGTTTAWVYFPIAPDAMTPTSERRRASD